MRNAGEGDRGLRLPGAEAANRGTQWRGQGVAGGVWGVLTAVGVIGHGDDAHGLLGDVDAQKFHVSAHVLVSSLHSPAHPVCPEDVIAIDSQAKGVHGLRFQDHLPESAKYEHEGTWLQDCPDRSLSPTVCTGGSPTPLCHGNSPAPAPFTLIPDPWQVWTHMAMGAIIFTALDFIQSGVREVNLLSPVVNGQPIGCPYVLVNDYEDVGTRQGGTHDAGVLLVPVGPEHQAGREGTQNTFANLSSLPHVRLNPPLCYLGVSRGFGIDGDIVPT